MLLAEFSIWPMDKGESVGPYVARCIEIVDRSGLPYRLGPLGTCIEGEWPDVMRVIQQCYEALGRRLQSHRLHRQNGLAQGPQRRNRFQDPVRAKASEL
jgi:uncharacterized protein (TIGR00106 family)